MADDCLRSVEFTLFLSLKRSDSLKLTLFSVNFFHLFPWSTNVHPFSFSWGSPFSVSLPSLPIGASYPAWSNSRYTFTMRLFVIWSSSFWHSADRLHKIIHNYITYMLYVTVSNLKRSYDSIYIRLIVYFLIIDTNRYEKYLHY